MESCCDCRNKTNSHKYNDNDEGLCLAMDVPRPATLEQAAASRIVAEAYNRGSMDNIATVVVDLSLVHNEVSVSF